MADIATLGLAVDSRPIATANDNLEKLGRTAKTTERSTEGFERSARKAGTATDRMARDVNRADKAMATMRRTLVGLAASFGGLVGASLAMRKFVDASIEAQAVQAQLAAALRSTGGASGQTVASLNAHAAALQKVTNFGDEATNTAQGILLTFTRIGGETFPRATVAVQNVATALKTDLQSAAIQVGKALNDPVLGMTALSRSGITFSEAQKEMVKSMVASNDMLGAQNLILKELETQFGGSAEAARNTLGGALSALGNAWGDLFEKTGGATEGLRKAIEGLVTAISSPGFTAFIGAIGTALLAALTAAAMAANLLVSGLSILGDNLDAIGVAAGTAGSLLLVAFGPAVFSAVVSGFFAMGAAGVTAIKAITAAMMANPLGALIVGITVAVTAAYYFRDEIKQAIGIDVVQTARDAANFIIGVFVGSFNAIVATFGKLPAAFGDLAYQAGYQFADHIRYWINEAILLIDSFITTMNDKIGTSISRPSVLRPVKYNNPFAGAASEAAATASAAFGDALDVDYIGKIGKAFESATPPVKDFSAALEGAGEEAGKLGGASDKSAKDTKKALKDIETDAEKAAKQLESTLGSVLADLFSKPIKDFDDFMDRITSGFAQLGQANLQKAFDGLLSGGGRTAANDNDPWAGMRIAVEKGARTGTTEGGIRGILTAFQSLGGGGGQPGSGGGGAGGALGAALGGFGMGYQSQNPAIGALGGVISGFAAGGPVGAIIGGIAGLLGGIFGGSQAKKEKRWAAAQSLNENRGAIENMIAMSNGQAIGPVKESFRTYQDESQKAQELAREAGDTVMLERIQSAYGQFFLRLQKDFLRGFEGATDALDSGLGSNSPFIKGKEAVESLREEMTGFVDDVAYMAEESRKAGFAWVSDERVAEMIEEARAAAVNMALATLTGAKELSTMESEVMRLSGSASALQVTLEDLGMASDAAAVAIDGALTEALLDLKKTLLTDISSSINELSSFGFINDLVGAQTLYETRVKDLTALGLDSSLAVRELNLGIADIARNASLTDEQLRMLASTFPALSSGLMAMIGVGGDMSVGDAQAAVDTARADLRAAYDAEADTLKETISRHEAYTKSLEAFQSSLRFDDNLSPLNAYQRLKEAQVQYQDVATAAINGDVDAIGKVEQVSRQYLEEARNYYGTSEAYFGIFTEVESLLDRALLSAQDQVSEAQAQLSVLEQMRDEQIGLGTTAVSIAEGVANLATATAALAAANDNQTAATNAQLAQLATLLAQTQAANNGSASAFSPEVTALYSDVVGRAPDAAGSLGWQAGFDVGMSKDEIYRLFIRDVIAAGAALQPGIAAQYGVPGFASGGMHMGGLRLVGERGPEIEATGPARIYTADQTRRMMSGGGEGTAEEVRALRSEVSELRKALVAATLAGAKANVEATERTTGAVRQQTSQALRAQTRRAA